MNIGTVMADAGKFTPKATFKAHNELGSMKPQAGEDFNAPSVKGDPPYPSIVTQTRSQKRSTPRRRSAIPVAGGHVTVRHRSGSASVMVDCHQALPCRPRGVF